MPKNIFQPWNKSRQITVNNNNHHNNWSNHEINDFRTTTL